MYNITLEVVAEDVPLQVHDLVALTERVLGGEGVQDTTEVSVLVTTDDEVRELNLRFLGFDEPTDVLSFPDESEGFLEAEGAMPYLGDIAIALPTAVRQADEIGHTIDAEVAHLLVHGLLHLCGYDHVNSAEEEQKMRDRERYYLGADPHVHAGHEH
jgi:probable rRNA maturation factor